MGDAGILKPTERVELIRGEIIEMSPIGPRHVAFVNNLNQLLVTRLQGAPSCPSRIPSRSMTTPSPSRISPSSGAAAPCHTRRPSPPPRTCCCSSRSAETSLAYDRATKLRLYAERASPSTGWWTAAEVIEIHRGPRPGVRRDAAPDRWRDRQPAGVPGHDPAPRGDLRVGDFTTLSGGSRRSREPQHTDRVRGNRCSNRPPRARDEAHERPSRADPLRDEGFSRRGRAGPPGSTLGHRRSCRRATTAAPAARVRRWSTDARRVRASRASPDERG